MATANHSASSLTEVPSLDNLPTQDPNLIIQRSGGVMNITLNNEKNKNCITQTMYLTLIHAFRGASTDNRVSVVTLTGAGEFFSSGNDLRPLAQLVQFADAKDQVSMDKWVHGSGEFYKHFVQSIYRCTKICVALVNGPSVGIACTILPLFDFVYCSDKATFHTPFMALGLAPEGQSSLTFPRLLGRQKASEFLLLGKKFSSSEAKQISFVNDVFPDQEFKARTQKIIKTLSGYDSDALMTAKMLIMDQLYGVLENMDKVCLKETEYLKRGWASDTSIEAIKMFIAMKMNSKL